VHPEIVQQRAQARTIVEDLTGDQVEFLKKWGVMADFDKSYQTMSKEYEANVLERLADLQ
jgi:isoleucyl-tRNA synthetase